MKRIAMMFALVSFLGFGLIVAQSHAAGMMGEKGFMAFDSKDLVGASVQNSDGKLIGIVNEVMVDTGGHAFAVINHGDYDLYGEGGVNTPVPFEALRISQTESGQEEVVLKLDREHLDFAPFLDSTQMKNREYEANIYAFYRIQPYWTEAGNCPK